MSRVIRGPSQQEIDADVTAQEEISEPVAVARLNQARALLDQNPYDRGEKRKGDSWMMGERPPSDPPDGGTRIVVGVEVKKKTHHMLAEKHRHNNQKGTEPHKSYLWGSRRSSHWFSMGGSAINKRVALKKRRQNDPATTMARRVVRKWVNMLQLPRPPESSFFMEAEIVSTLRNQEENITRGMKKLVLRATPSTKIKIATWEYERPVNRNLGATSHGDA